jgi:hypothetical protein
LYTCFWLGFGYTRILRALVTSLSIEATSEDSENGEKIFGELALGAETRLVENHELSTVLFDQELDAVEPEPGESVFMGNHKPELVTLQNSSQ